MILLLFLLGMGAVFLLIVFTGTTEYAICSVASILIASVLATIVIHLWNKWIGILESYFDHLFKECPEEMKEEVISRIIDYNDRDF
jgi:flagellar motor component MotA